MGFGLYMRDDGLTALNPPRGLVVFFLEGGGVGGGFRV